LAALDLPLRRDYLGSSNTGKAPMAITVEELETLLKEGFPNARVTITDLAGDGNHYAAEVIDESFRGLNRVQQQRAVYAALKGKMDGSHGELHALALTTKAPD
jgi:stress-induced morphogen